VSKAKGKGKARAKRPAPPHPAPGGENHVENHVTDDHIPGRNGGRLRRGGTNKGGPGRPSNGLRNALLELAEGKGLEVLQGWLNGKNKALQKAALDFALKYGLGQKHEIDGGVSPIQVAVMVGPALLAEQPNLGKLPTPLEAP
jgi:hypothetical protein